MGDVADSEPEAREVPTLPAPVVSAVVADDDWSDSEVGEGGSGNCDVGEGESVDVVLVVVVEGDVGEGDGEGDGGGADEDVEGSLGCDADPDELSKQLSSSPLCIVTALVVTELPVASTTLKATENDAGILAAQVKEVTSRLGKTLSGGARGETIESVYGGVPPDQVIKYGTHSVGF